MKATTKVQGPRKVKATAHGAFKVLKRIRLERFPFHTKYQFRFGNGQRGSTLAGRLSDGFEGTTPEPHRSSDLRTFFPLNSIFVGRAAEQRTFFPFRPRSSPVSKGFDRIGEKWFAMLGGNGQYGRTREEIDLNVASRLAMGVASRWHSWLAVGAMSQRGRHPAGSNDQGAMPGPPVHTACGGRHIHPAGMTRCTEPLPRPNRCHARTATPELPRPNRFYAWAAGTDSSGNCMRRSRNALRAAVSNLSSSGSNSTVLPEACSRAVLRTRSARAGFFGNSGPWM